MRRTFILITLLQIKVSDEVHCCLVHVERDVWVLHRHLLLEDLRGGTLSV